VINEILNKRDAATIVTVRSTGGINFVPEVYAGNLMGDNPTSKISKRGKGNLMKIMKMRDLQVFSVNSKILMPTVKYTNTAADMKQATSIYCG